MWANIDAAQLRGWQYLVNLYGKHTGQTHFNVVRLMLVVYLAAVVSLWMSAPDKFKTAAMVMAAVVAILTPVFFLMVGYVERQVAQGAPNPERSWASGINRLIQTGNAAHTMCVCAWSWDFQPSNLSSVAMWIAFYLLACDVPPPPQKREIGENFVWDGA